MEKTTLSGQIKELIALLKRYLGFQKEYWQLSAAEKLSVLMSRILVTMVLLLTGMLFLLLCSLALVDALKGVMPSWGAYLCGAALVLVVLGIILLGRRAIIVNPVTRLITRLLAPKKTDKNG